LLNQLSTVPSDSNVADVGLHVMKTLCSSSDCFHQFCVDWRIHFLDTMKPMFLSSNWNSNYRRPNEQTNDQQQEHKNKITFPANDDNITKTT
jgi:hypothetical protein